MNECLDRMLDADRPLYERCINTPGFAQAFSRLAELAGQRDEVIAHAERWVRMKEEGDQAGDVLKNLVQRYKGGKP